jgi:hypothetical protein
VYAAAHAYYELTTSKVKLVVSSKACRKASSKVDFDELQHTPQHLPLRVELLRQFLYVCTSKASKAATWMLLSCVCVYVCVCVCVCERARKYVYMYICINV